MRTYLTVCLMVLTIGCGAARKTPKTAPTAPPADKIVLEKSDKMSLEEAILYLERVPEGESKRDRDIRLLALQKAKKEEKAKLERELAKGYLRLERDAAKEITKSERIVKKNTKAEARAKSMSLLSCPNPEDRAAVWVNPAATEWGAGFSHSVMTIVNKEEVPVTIKQYGGAQRIAAEDLRPGCSLTFVQRMRPYGSREIAYEATAFKEKGVAVSRSPRLSLHRCNIGNDCATLGNWEIHLR